MINATPGTQHHKRDLTGGRRILHPVTEFQSIHIGHHHITDDAIRRYLLHQFQRLPAITCFINDILVFQNIMEQVPDARFIFYY